MTPPSGFRRRLALLSVGQACAFATIFLAVFAGPFAVREMTGTFALGGLPVAMYSLSSLLMVVPAGRLMDRIGRRPVLTLGHGTAAGGTLLVATSLSAAAVAGSWAVVSFLLGLFLLSAGTSIAVLARVAVADLYRPEERVRGIGRIVFISFAGSGAGAAIFFALGSSGAVPVASAYFAMLPIFAIAAVAMALLGRDPVRSFAAKDPRARSGIVLRRPGVGWTVASNAGANGGMAGVMSLASAAMGSFSDVAMGAVMLGHFGGMFLPSPLAGQVAQRRGRPAAILTGGVMLAVGALLFARIEAIGLAALGLFAVGAGWCLTYIPGTALLADATAYAERGTLIAVNDALVALFSIGAVLLAGFAFNMWGVVGLSAFGASCAILPVAAATLLSRRPPRGVPSVG